MTVEEELVERLLTGEARALARAISIVEDRLPAARGIMKRVAPLAGHAPIIGVTGPPGAGKSTLVDGLTSAFRREEKKVGIIAVDPSSTFSGGAVLGDRIRMQRHSLDEGVFIRSMATRGHFGGLASASVDVADLMSAAGFDVVIIETVGVGQDEVDVVRVADVVVVVLVPGLGDDIQTIKAGIMEIPDIFVLNKADREGIDRLHSEVKAMLGLTDQPGRRAPEILRTVATSATGIDELHRTITTQLESRPSEVAAARRRDRSRERLLDLMRERLIDWACGPASGGALDRMIEDLANRALDPYSAADRLLEKFSLPREEPMIIDHLGIAVRSLEGSLRFYRDALGIEAGGPEEIATEGVRVAFLSIGESRIELLEPLGPDSPVAKFLDKRGEGIHHVCLRVEGLDEMLAALRARSAEIIEPAPRMGAGGHRIAFIHPRSAAGVLVELVESPHPVRACPPA